MMTRILAAILFCSVLATGPAAATDMPNAPALPSVTFAERVDLTETDVTRFLDSLASLRDLEADHPEIFEALDDDTPLAPEAQAAFERVVQGSGFGDEAHWNAVAQSVFVAYAAIEEGLTAEDLASQVEEMRSMEAMIADIPGMPEDQKAMMLEQARQQMALFARTVPSAGNLEAVRPYAPQIKAAVEALE